MQQRGRSVCATGGMSPGTCAPLLSPPPANTSLEASPNGTWNLCSRRACHEHFQSHYAIVHGSEGLTSVSWPLAAARCPSRLCLWTWPDFPLASSWRNLQRWGGHRSHEREWMLFRSGLQPYPGFRYDAPWKGRPSYNRGCGRLRIWCWIRHSNGGGLGDIGHITGRGHIYILVHPVLSRLLWTAAPSSRTQSLLPVAVDVHVGLGPPR